MVALAVIDIRRGMVETVAHLAAMAASFNDHPARALSVLLQSLSKQIAWPNLSSRGPSV
jgi:hypothetical protein